jgi:hypothetical protein
MSKRLFTFALLAAALLALRGESCFLHNREIEVPFRGDVVTQYTSQGNEDFAIVTIDLGAELEAIEDDVDAAVDSLVSFDVEGGFWRLVENRGDPGTTITGSITIQRLPLGSTAYIVSPTTVAIESVGTEFVPAPLNEAGVDILLAGFQEYLDWRNSGRIGPRPVINYLFTWSSAGSGNVDFDWEAKLVFTLVGVFEVEVPDLWD